ncbi:YqzL family protein [Brevibacillus humidisoli]|uniref:YqzL family protein n=1 Tax=Brevibacillus humidisoli TaxID=2895522 RepID=UPI001E5AAE7C|nr:YqzL family protein [Brevibacillus humidisoli]UFJ43145.1 YqzL family protein [Brevibacillus humidisoli]
MLRDFSWSYFASTGDIHAYLLYREHQQIGPHADEEADSTRTELGESTVCL